MTGAFQSFVVFAEMRTGSNFLESNLNAFDGITCHGEAFNPHFMGYPNSDPILGVDLATRDKDPLKLLRAVQEDPGQLNGFRYFHDHDPRVFDAIIEDRTCAKIVLTRNPVESYVSWKIAQATGQWKLTDMKAHKPGQATFDGDEFAAHLDALQRFQIELLNRLQKSGQTAFYVAYEDLQSVDVMNGIAKYLGVNEALEGLDKKLKKQNPSPISAKVKNYDAMLVELAKLDRFDLTRTPNFEPRRGPAVPTYVVAAESALVYMPLKSGPVHQVLDWMAALDGVGRGKLQTKLGQKELRQWKRAHPGFRTFTVLRHPVLRAHDAFCRHILTVEKGSYRQLRATMIRRYKLPIPPDGPDAAYDLEAHRKAFTEFLRFLKGNLAGQTGIRIDAAWCTQAQAISGFGEVALPDRLVREEDLAEDLAHLAQAVGRDDAPALGPVAPDQPFTLADIYDERIEKLASEAYQRDYVTFGFSNWG